MKYRTILLAAVLATLSLSVSAQQTTVNILSVNDMHATIEQMPRLAFVADSLRAIDPDLIVLSAGDNRTGNPYNDRFEISAYPMVALMNAVGFDASAVGNHEWDSNTTGLRTIANLASFPFICCNAIAPDTMNIGFKPFTILHANGLNIGVIGTLQTNVNGIPDSHPKNLRGMTFKPASTVIPQYLSLRDKCDVLLLLSHEGYEEDIKTAGLFPQFDAIIGGHSHTLVAENEFHNNVLITQAKNKLKYAFLTTITLDGGKVVNRSSKQIPLTNGGGINKDVERLMKLMMQNPELEKKVVDVASDFQNAEELGSMVCDALASATNCDIALQNGGGVRFSTFPAGPMTLSDVLRLDPFGNEAIIYEITGKEVADLILNCFDIDEKQIPYVSGIKYEMTIDKSLKPTGIKIRNLDGSKFDMKRTYRFVTNSYVSAILPAPKSDPGSNTFRACSDYVLDYFQSHPSIDYQGTHRAEIIKK